MKRLYIFDEYANSSQNGIGTYIGDLKKHLSDVVEVSVLSFNDTVGSFRKEEKEGVTYYRFPAFCSGSFLGNCEVGLTVMRLEIADASCNIFLLNYFLCNDLLRAMKEYYPLSKTVFVIHDQIWTEKLLGDRRKLKRIINNPEAGDGYSVLRNQVLREREMYELADKVVTVSEDTQELLRSVYCLAAGKISFIPHGKEICSMSRSLRTRNAKRKKMLLDADEKIMLYVGRATRCKGFHATLAAFEKVAQAFPQVKLVVLGRVNDVSEVVRLCPTSKTRIVFAGLVGKEELRSWYQVADIGLVPSYSEQCGYAGMEMMACGLPIVASDGQGVRRMFKDGYNSVVAKIGNREKPEVFVNNLGRAMMALLEMDDQQLDRLRRNARRTYSENYAMRGMKDAYLRLIDELASEDKNDSVAILPKEADRSALYEMILGCNDLYSRGLFKGRMGVVLALMEYSRKYALLPLKDFCIYTIQRCTVLVPGNTETGFASGMAGIGWALDYLKWRNLVDIDTAGICREIDRRLMRCSPLRTADYTLDTGLEGLLIYVNLHLYNNRGKTVFEDSYLAELRTVVKNLPANAGDNLRAQASLFERLIDGEECEPDVSLSQFVGDFRNGDITLRHGLAGKLLGSL